MTEQLWLTQQFELHQIRLRAVAYRMLGSIDQASDAVQQARQRIDVASADTANLSAWLTAIVARQCLDTLRSRGSERNRCRHQHAKLVPNTPLGGDRADTEGCDDAVGLAVLVVLETIPPLERLAFVLHELLAIPLQDTAQILGRSPEATEALARRARQHIRGAAGPPPGS
ncbi:MAG: sigma factor [Solirubrobacterales bacterium]